MTNHLFPNSGSTELQPIEHVLVVDDDKISRRLFTLSLKKINYTATLVTSGSEALEFLQTQMVDVILLDLLMPDMDGFAVLAELKAHEQWQRIPVIVISGLTDTSQVVKCMQMGAVDYLTKPVNATILKARLEAALSSKRLADMAEMTRLSLAKSEARFRAIFNATVDGIVTTNERGIIESVNPAVIRIFGYSPDSLKGESITILIAPNKREQLNFHIKTFLQTGMADILDKQVETEGQRQDGTLFPLYFAPSKAQAEDHLFFTVIVRDLTDLKRAKVALLDALTKTQALYRVSRSLMSYKNFPNLLQTVVDEVAKTLPANRVWLHIFDLKQKQVKHFVAGGPGREEYDRTVSTSYDILMEGLIGWVIEHSQPALATKETRMRDARVTEKVRQDRADWNIGATIVCPLYYKQNTIGTLTVVNRMQDRDFTEADVQLVESLGNQVSVAIDNMELYAIEQQQKYELQQRNEELDAFAGMVAHDLKNPLTAIKGFTYLLLESSRNQPEETRRHWLENIAAVGDKMDQIVRELLLLARIRRESVDLEPVMMDMVLINVQDRLDYMIQEYQPELIVSDDWVLVWGYVGWLEEVWVNYISNALKYGGKPPRVEVGMTPQDDMVCFWVKDNGRGIDPADQVDLFKPFTRFDDGEIEGHGLGLSIVQRIVEKLGGKVGANSVVGRGSQFWFTLPICDEE